MNQVAESVEEEQRPAEFVEALAKGDEVVTSGGRVLGVTALGDSIAAAKLQAYKAVKCIRWDGAWCRKDISDKALTS